MYLAKEITYNMVFTIDLTRLSRVNRHGATGRAGGLFC